jgi:hypothetical protein
MTRCSRCESGRIAFTQCPDCLIWLCGYCMNFHDCLEENE